MNLISKDEDSRVTALIEEAKSGSIVSVQQLVRLGKTQALFEIFEETHEEQQALATQIISCMAMMRSEEGEAILSQIQSQYPSFQSQAEMAARRSVLMRTPYPRSRNR
ncbi:MAG: hypothetical protein CMK59_14360 [Proteobacteria bacterium]|nr:hypothetical protein [Pseudomonadota bacterium]